MMYWYNHQYSWFIRLICCVFRTFRRLRLFQTFESFRVIVAGGDGSIGWVLNEIDHLGLQKEASYQTNLSPSSPK